MESLLFRVRKQILVYISKYTLSNNLLYDGDKKLVANFNRKNMHNAFYSSKCCHYMKEDEIDEACSPHWREEKCIQNFDFEACRKANTSKSKRRCEENIRIVLKNRMGGYGLDSYCSE